MENLFLNTVNDLLDYSNILSNSIKIENIQFDLRKLINDFYSNNHLTSEMKGLDFNFKIDTELPNYFTGDPGRIRQILSNLYNNAVKFTKSGNVELKCKLIEENSNFTTVKFEISDTGIGIDKYKIENLFKEFNQLNNSFSREFQGLGLGLTISKKTS